MTDLIKELKTLAARYGKVEVCKEENNKLYLKITKGFSSNAANTFQLNNMIMNLVGSKYSLIDRCVTDDNLFDLVLKKELTVYILGRDQFKNIMLRNDITNDNVEEKDVVFISINNTNEPEYKPHFENKSNVLVQYFDDLDEDIEDKGLFYKAFTEEQGKELIAFIEKNKNKKQFIVHCTAGISRSGAVGTFINIYLGGDYEKFRKTNPFISPNPHVMSILNKLTR